MWVSCVSFCHRVTAVTGDITITTTSSPAGHTGWRSYILSLRLSFSPFFDPRDFRDRNGGRSRRRYVSSCWIKSLNSSGIKHLIVWKMFLTTRTSQASGLRLIWERLNVSKLAFHNFNVVKPVCFCGQFVSFISKLCNRFSPKLQQRLSTESIELTINLCTAHC